MPKIISTPSTSTLTRLVGQAMGDYGMIDGGDRVAVAVSGGRDSVFLLEMLRHFKRVAPIDFEIIPVFVDIGLPRFPIKRLKEYFESTGLAYEIVPAEKIKEKSWDDIECFGCSDERRKLLFQTAGRLKCNKVALGHNQDDIAETILLNLFFRGEISAMCPKQALFHGALTVIRPLCYVRPQEIAQLAKQREVPTFKGNKCPNDHGSQRMHIRRLLKEIEKTNPHIKKNIVSALRKIKVEYLP